MISDVLPVGIEVVTIILTALLSYGVLLFLLWALKKWNSDPRPNNNPKAKQNDDMLKVSDRASAGLGTGQRTDDTRNSTTAYAQGSQSEANGRPAKKHNELIGKLSLLQYLFREKKEREANKDPA